MRIVNVCVHYQDKLGYQEYYLGKEWHKQGHEVHFVTSDVHFDFPDYDNTVKMILGDKYVGTGVFHTDYGVTIHRLKSTNKKLSGRIWLQGMREKLLELKPEIIISHGIFSWHSIRLLYMHKELNCPIVFDEHTTVFNLRKDMASQLIYSIFRKVFARKFQRVAHKVIGISTTSIDVIEDYFGIKGKKVCMIPLGTDQELFSRNQALRHERRTELGVGEDTIVVTYTGKIYPEKRVDLIIDALNDPEVAQNSKILIYLVGNAIGTYADVFNRKLAESIHPVIHIKAVPASDLVAVYNASDIAVWPDSLTNSTVDASACGCPIICSEYMIERVSFNNGIAIPAGSLSHLKKALALLIRDRVMRQTMSNNAVSYVEQEANWSSIAKKFIA